MKRLFDLLVPAGFLLAFVLVAFDAHALTRELRWTHPQPSVPIWLFVVADGENVAQMLVDEPDEDGVFTTLVVIPFGAEIQIQVQDSQGGTSELSNIQIYGDQCRDWDNNRDGTVGGPDFMWFRAEFVGGTASLSEYGRFRSFFGQTCG